MAPNYESDELEEETEDEVEEEEVHDVPKKRAKKGPWKVRLVCWNPSWPMMSENWASPSDFVSAVHQDPNKPKRAMSAFFLFSQANRNTVKEENPEASFGDIVSVNQHSHAF